MRSNMHTLITLLMMIIVAALYRVIPDRPMGFAPHLAMALFAGAVIKDKKLAFAFPIFSMFFSDVIYHLLYLNGITAISGFYEGQFTNYLLFAAMTIIGFLMRKINVPNIVMFSFIICCAFFLLSNFFVWNAGSGFGRPHNFPGLMQAYADGLPFFRNSIFATLA
ncbi:MAG TPA: DUF6580 family putative transport protein, partial [Flavitalea sp.]|nr:DUF6580 family putative transport protein [Flavitalea sp.]